MIREGKNNLPLQGGHLTLPTLFLNFISIQRVYSPL